MGTRLDYSKIPGMREHASPFKYLGDALYLRNQLVRMLEEAEAESDPESRKSLLTFVVAGGGFSGVECIAEMNDFLREAVSAYHNISGARSAADLASARRAYLAGGDGIACGLRAQASRGARRRDPARRRLEGGHRQRRRC